MSNPYPDLMIFWAICISWSAAFLTLVSIYLYMDSKKNLRKYDRAITSQSRRVRDFLFVWVLLGLLALYIISIDRGSAIVFAAGNIVVEALLIVYTAKNRTSKGSAETQKPFETQATH